MNFRFGTMFNGLAVAIKHLEDPNQASVHVLWFVVLSLLNHTINFHVLSRYGKSLKIRSNPNSK